MELFKLTPEDLRWMRQRLGRTLRLTAVMLMISLAAHASSAVKKDVREREPVIQSNVRLISNSTLVPERALNSVPPIGWRRTARGWEHVSTWSLPIDSIESLMKTQAARESTMARGLLAKVSGLSPVTFAVVQILAILAIVGAAQLAQRKPMPAKAACPDPNSSDG